MNNRKNLLRLLLFVSLSFVAVILNGQTVSKTSLIPQHYNLTLFISS